MITLFHLQYATRGAQSPFEWKEVFTWGDVFPLDFFFFGGDGHTDGLRRLYPMMDTPLI